MCIEADSDAVVERGGRLREKGVGRKESVVLGEELRAITKAAGVWFIVNDDIELARLIRADGVHLGQDDAPVAKARGVLGADAIVGVSVGTCAEAERAIADGADYIGVGCVFGTGTKVDAGAAIGVEELCRVVQFVDGRIPVVAIGGVDAGNAALCREAGADGVAVVSAVMKSERPGEVAGRLAEVMGA